MANHTDEHGKSTPARSTVAKRMRVALRGQKHSGHRAETRSAGEHYAYAGRSKKQQGPFRSRSQAVREMTKKHPRSSIQHHRGKYGQDIGSTKWTHKGKG